MKFKERNLLKRGLDILITGCLYVVYLMTRVVSMQVFGILFGMLAALLCPLIPETYLASRNLKNAFPEKSRWERVKIICGMWLNLGLFAGEYCYVHTLPKERLEKIFNFVGDRDSIIGGILDNFKNKRGTVLLSGHFANWEMGLRYFIQITGIKVNIVYRKSNNTLLEKTLVQKFKRYANINLIAKQDNAGIKMVRALKNGELVVLLIDQLDKQRGILSDFFGRKTYTNTTAYTLYKKLDVDLYYAYILRQKNFLKTDFFCEKLNFDKENITEIELADALNKKLEDSIRKKPSQWFWVHNRWRIQGRKR